tara:strand:+ start:145 stop:612 length:468 start_codon:yes stop_codon:yes gene_type:complete
MDINHTIIIKSNHWPRRFSKAKKVIKKIFRYKKLLDFDYKLIYYCNIVLMDDSQIRKFNKLYKKQDKSTDVLTFMSKIKKNSVIEKHCDIMISAETTFNDAKEKNIVFYDHLAHLIIHSILHINGYSHNNNKNFLIMKNNEVKILNKLGISNPYL